jgi:hypothetical protein
VIPDVEGEVAEAGRAAAPRMELLESELPPGSLLAGMFANDAIEPALDPA